MEFHQTGANSQPAASFETPTEVASLTCSAASVIAHFESEIGKVYRETWLLIKARDLERLKSFGIPTLADVLKADLGAVERAVGPWMKKRSNQGRPVEVHSKSLSIFKAESHETFGTNAVFLAFGTKRPKHCVADEHLKPISSPLPQNSSCAGGGGVAEVLDDFLFFSDGIDDNEFDGVVGQSEGSGRSTRSAARRYEATQRKKPRRPSNGTFMTNTQCLADLERKSKELRTVVATSQQEQEETTKRHESELAECERERVLSAKKVARLENENAALQKKLAAQAMKAKIDVETERRRGSAKLGQVTKQCNADKKKSATALKKAATTIVQERKGSSSKETALKLAHQEIKRKTRELAHREMKVEKEKEKRQKQLACSNEQTLKFKQQRDLARREKRDVKKQVASYQREIEKSRVHVKMASAAAMTAQAETSAMALELTDKEVEVDELTAELMRARKLLPDAAKKELDILIEESRDVDVEERVSLVGLLGKKGELWSQDIIELGMEMMEKGLSAPQAEAVTRAFVVFLHPDKTEGVDYRIPSQQRFKEWRSFLALVCHYLAVSCIKLAVRAHLLHDATTKNGLSVFQTAARCEVRGDDGSTFTVDFPVKFELLPSADAATEGALVAGSLQCEHGDGAYASLLAVESVSSDNAARATSRNVIERKKLAVEAVREMSDEALRQAPRRLEHAAELWSQMSEEQRKVAQQCQELGCTGHSLHLVFADSVKKTEAVVLEANVVREVAINTIRRAVWKCAWRIARKKKGLAVPPNKLVAAKQPRFTAGTGWAMIPWEDEEGKKPRARMGVWKHNGHSSRTLKIEPAGKYLGSEDAIPDVPSLTIALSKSFSPSGDDAKYHLNESIPFSRFCELNGLEPTKVPPRKGSRQMWELEVGTAHMVNAPLYVRYLHVLRADDKDLNKLIMLAWRGVGDKYAVAAWSARSFIHVVFAKPIWFLVHSGLVKRDKLSSLMRLTEQWILSLGTLDDLGIAPPPLVDSFSSLVLREQPEWKASFDAWYALEGEDLELAHRIATGRDRWHLVSPHLAAACQPMVTTLLRNLDQDHSGNARVLNAPILTDSVESGFGAFDYTLCRPGAPSVESAWGVAHAQKMHALTNTSELRKKAEATVKDKRSGGGVGTEDDVQLLLQQRKFTSWRQALPREKRSQVVKSLQRNLRLHGEQRRKKREELADKAIERKRKGVEAAVNRRLRAVANYPKHQSIVPIANRAEFIAVKDTHAASGDPASTWGDLLRDQIRHRMHAREHVPEQALPRLGGGSDDAELTRLEEAVEEMIQQPLPRMLAEPSPEFHPAPLAPTIESAAAHREHLKQTIKSYRQFIELTAHGIFRLPPLGGDEVAEVLCGGGGGGSSRNSGSQLKAKASQSRTKAPRRVTLKERQLVGQTFEDDGVDWKVLDVAWSEEVDPPQVMVYYYDVDAVVAEGILECDLLEVLDEGRDDKNMEHIEWSKVSEVRAWLLASGASEK